VSVADLRVAEATDVDAVAELEATTFGPDAWSAAVVAEELAAPGRSWLVATDGQELVGYAVTWTVDEVADLQRVVVAPAARRRGLATRLLRELTHDAAGRGARRVLLEVSAANHAALGCYDRLGFRPIDRRPAYYRDGSDAVVHQLDLTTDQTSGEAP
jgi:ribosomal-protein-alanine acetyltransferase